MKYPAGGYKERIIEHNVSLQIALLKFDIPVKMSVCYSIVIQFFDDFIIIR